MAFTRRILWGWQPDAWQDEWQHDAVSGAWFELLRWGGCGAGEVTLARPFALRHSAPCGSWLAFENPAGTRWYLGQIVERRARWPQGITLRLQGPGARLQHLFPGAYAGNAFSVPQRFAVSDDFLEDPDASQQHTTRIRSLRDLLGQLYQHLIAPHTTIRWDDGLIAPADVSLRSFKFRGEDSLAEILHDLASRAQQAAWGVDEQQRLFFLSTPPEPACVITLGEATPHLTEITTHEWLYNRLLLTGGYEYTSSLPPMARRWRGHYRDLPSIAEHGERRLALTLPWIRTAEDARSFAAGFFRSYAHPCTRYEVTWLSEHLPRPWSQPVELRDPQTRLFLGPMARLRVQFDRVPLLQLQLGVADPHQLLAVTRHLETYPLVPMVGHTGWGGEDLSLSGSADEAADSALPERWQVAFPGLTAGSCPSCPAWQATWMLQREVGIPGVEVWRAELPRCTHQRLTQLELRLAGGQLVLRVFAHGQISTYRRQGPLTAGQPCTLSLEYGAPCCTQWPSEITIVPA
ncbi:MAG: hypothetical protein KatS3mg114_1451 [Planctomycetaceae bacterium]|nr:MAG: hypothetical protein KatS3mg114_1451 [Planctomycetaceae bacterium]